MLARAAKAAKAADIDNGNGPGVALTPTMRPSSVSAGATYATGAGASANTIAVIADSSAHTRAGLTTQEVGDIMT
jgi:hypothetical protein